MSSSTKAFSSSGLASARINVSSEPCVMLIFGASGDLTKRLLIPAIYNLACDNLLSENFAVLGTATRQMDDAQFREKLSGEKDGIKAYHTRSQFDQAVWDGLVERINYQSGSFDDLEHFKRLKQTVVELDRKYGTSGNVLLYFATAPRFFGTICENLHKAGFKDTPGWVRIIVEKPFGTDLASSRELNAEVLAHWDEKQIYRVDHYLGKETVQNLLSFRFSNGMFEPLWNNHHIDNIQFNVCEAVDVQGRGGYYDSSGVLRDMMQNHMFQMLAYLCMEPPSSFAPDAIRNEKAKLLQSVRIYTEAEVKANVVRGQYGPALNERGEAIKPGYRQEDNVAADSCTETFAAAKLQIDNWRWEGVPIYLRSGKALWKRGTEIIVEFKRPPQATFQGTGIESLEPNRLVFHIQPDQGIELRFQAKIPGPTLNLQNVDMRFDYGDAFKASRYTGYEVMIYSCTHADSTLFSRGDLVEAAWQIAQPMLDYWQTTPAPDFPNYARGSWGPKAASELLARDGRRWFEVVTPEVLEKSPLFKGADPLLLNTVIMALHSTIAEAGDTIITQGDLGSEMYLICHGEVDVLDDNGTIVRTLKDGDCFGEIGLLISVPRTATIKAKTSCDLFVLERASFSRILRNHPQFAATITTIAKERYDINLSSQQLTD